jgi:hypothetical protein
MRRLIVLLIGVCYGSLSAYCATSSGNVSHVKSSGTVPGAVSSDSPALAALKDHLVLAWASEPGVQSHQVRYTTTVDGKWMPPREVAGALTTSAPALGVADKRLYLATTPPRADDKIYLYSSSGTAFLDHGSPLCDGDNCARTRAAPALVGDGAVLYAAWSTPDGAVSYATFTNHVWNISRLPIPDALTNATTGPTVAVYQNRLYVAWVRRSGGAVSVASTALPLSSSSWSVERVEVQSKTQVSPRLGVLLVPDSALDRECERKPTLVLSWTTIDSLINFARWNSSAAQWMASDSPIPLPSGRLSRFPIALNSFQLESANHQLIDVNALVYADENSPPQLQSHILRLKVCP